ncbi:MAG: UDP-N-acetylmuramoyl-L-alanyl-D-glutamate--2,6-diaminopimelate ligase [Deltaproteobacteria bacterium]|nr:UDP-N-acetylmuramoyl-L-alanyl-D-glutamate--2,6-diaminopimelate ligase [Deltaproteobacteria bacterium]
MKKLSELIKDLPDKRIVGNSEIPIQGITYDSRQAGKDFIFAAIKGQHLDGARFIPDVVKKGGSAVLAEEAVSTTATQVIVPDAREAMAKMSAIFYGEPSKHMALIGVTGTNGKTTATYLVESILRNAGFHAGVVGTVNYRYKDKIFNAPHTTPEAPDLQKIFKEMVDDGITHCVMEVSSHALSQKRVAGCRFVGAAFTNLTQEHLDYHKTMAEYFKSKSRLFTDFVAKEKDGFSVINTDDSWGRRLPCMGCGNVFRYSMNNDAEIFPQKALFSLQGIEACLNTPIGLVDISSPLLGEYNLQNIMAAVGIGIGLGLNKRIIENGIAGLKGVHGRLERIVSKDGFQAVVDYAHTGDALERVLNALRPLAKGRLITVFGCGGDRDRGKRPLMGEIAARLSNFTIITSDNPRSEDPLEIIKEVEKGIKGGRKWEVGSGKKDFSTSHTPHPASRSYAVIPDRHEAIKVAVSMATPQDIILVAGKGHEDYQIIGDHKIPFDDMQEIKKAMEERYAIKAAG